MNTKLFTLGIFFLLSISSFAQQLRLIDENGRIEVEGRMQHLVDKTGNYSLEQVLTLPMRQLDTTASPNFGFNRFVHWFKLDVKNNSTTKEWFLEVPFAPLDQVNFYLEPDTGSVWIHKVSGDIFPMFGKDVRHRNPAFSFTVLPGTQRATIGTDRH